MGAGDRAPLLSRPSSGAAAYASITPADTYYAAYLSFVLLGAGFLFPWNATIDAVGYFNGLYPGAGIEFWFSVCYMCPNLFGLVFVVNWGEKLSFRFRIICGFTIFLACIVALPLVHVEAWTLIVVCILGFSDAIVQGSIYGLSGQFHPRYVGAVMSGNGVAGVTVAVLRIITKLIIPAGPDANQTSAVLYFALSAAVIVGCIIAYWRVLERSPVTKFYLGRTRDERSEHMSKLSQSGAPLSVPTSGAYLPPSGGTAGKSGLAMVHDAPSSGADRAMAKSTADPESGKVGVVNAVSTKSRGPLAVFFDVWPMAFAAGFNFLVTLALFPGITSEMTSTHFSVESGWFPIILITIFNMCDFIGRTVPRWDSLIFITPKQLPFVTICRLVFIPLFLLSLHPKIFVSDIWMYLFMIGMGLSNGYCGTLAMMYGPQRVGIFDKEQAGTVMVFCLTCGLTAGVWCGVFLKDLVDAGTL